MPNTFKNYFLKNAGTTAANVYAPAAATQATVIGLTIGNTTASPITANVTVVSGGTTHFMYNKQPFQTVVPWFQLVETKN